MVASLKYLLNLSLCPYSFEQLLIEYAEHILLSGSQKQIFGEIIRVNKAGVTQRP